MDESYNKESKDVQYNQLTTFSVPYSLEEINEYFINAKKDSINNSKEDILIQAIKYHLDGDIQKAEKYYKNCIEQGINDPIIFSNYGSILKHYGKLNEAEFSQRKAIQLNPDFAEAYYNLGNTLNELGKRKEAEIFIRKAIKIKPNYIDAYYNLGNILRRLGKFKEAEISERKAIEINPNNAEAFNNLGITLRELGKLREAELSQRKAIDLKPDYFYAYYNLGLTLKEIGKLKEAEISERKAIEINPYFAEAYNNLGVTLKELGKLNESELFLHKAIELKPRYAEAHYNLGVTYKELGDFKNAEFFSRKAIEYKSEYAEAHNNLGIIFKDLGKYVESELYLRKAIEYNPEYADAYYNLGIILKELGNLNQAELSELKAININPYFAKAYFILSTLKFSDFDKNVRNKLFSKNILKKISKEEQVDIFFARANILHKENDYLGSSKYLQLANKIKLELRPFSYNSFVREKLDCHFNSTVNSHSNPKDLVVSENIFIVGMPRSGSTLLESIISMNSSVKDLGEVEIFEELLIESNKNSQLLPLGQLYIQNVMSSRSKMNITTNKCLYNYKYSDIIASQIPNSKIFHCFRNPLDNILSIFRAHFAFGNEYSSSLEYCAKVLLYQDEIMEAHKKNYRSQIFDLNYDELVQNPNRVIKSIIFWLGWEWDDKYLSPHMNTRSVSTASSVQVRYPINSRSVGGSRNYTDMLRPAIEVLNKSEKFKNL